MRDSAAIAVGRPVAGPVRSPWIVGPAADILLVVATPAILAVSLTAAQVIWSPAQIGSFALVWAIGHHLPGMMRAYGDRALFQRFRWRFVAAPLVLIAIGVYSHRSRSSAIPLAIGLWGWWHYLMQAYGFIRIYDAKAGSVDPLTCRLDQAMCLAWFAAPIALTSNGLFSYLKLFYQAGGPDIPPFAVTGFQYGVLLVLVAVTLLFLLNAIHQTQQGRPPGSLKLALMITNFGYYWYSLATVSNLLVSYALYELFHDVQYLTIVWAFNQRRAEGHQGAGAFTWFLFRKRWWLVIVYIALVFGYGLLNYATRSLSEGAWQRALLGLFLASTMLHYYYDGFIWKIRESETRQPLGLADMSARGRGWNPAWSWWLAAVPLCGLAALIVHERRVLNQEQTTGLPAFPLTKHDALASVLPQSVFVHLHRGIALAEAGRLDEAEAEYRQARELNPYYAEVAYNLGNVLSRSGRVDEAMEQYRESLRLNPNHVEANYNVGVLLMQQGRAREAVPFLEAAVGDSPRRPEIHCNLGSALVRIGKRPEAVDHFRRALELQPDFAEAHANLGQTLSSLGHLEGALTHARRAADLQPDSATAHLNLGAVFERLQRLDDAVKEYRQAVTIQPADSAGWNNLGVALARQRQLEEALQAFRRAVALAPDDSAARQNLDRAEQMSESRLP